MWVALGNLRSSYYYFVGQVDTVKRMCVRQLPKRLAIQLKRFDYDWERECPIKFNDYFEFPRELDMEPFTVYGLAKMEGAFKS